MNLANSFEIGADYSSVPVDDYNSVLDDILDLQTELCSIDHQSPVDMDIFEYLIPDISSLSETSNVQISCDRSINQREWLITDQKSKRQRPPFLYEFLILLLHKPGYESYVSYKDRTQGIFEITEPDKIADLWEKVKNRQATQRMTYDKFARAIRCYYKSDIMVKTNARYTFQFSQKTLSRIAIDENNNIIILSSTTNENLDSSISIS